MLTKVAAATQILSNSLKALDSLREQAKSSSNMALKANISTLYDSLLDLKAAVLRVEEENAELRRSRTSQSVWSERLTFYLTLSAQTVPTDPFDPSQGGLSD